MDYGIYTVDQKLAANEFEFAHKDLLITLIQANKLWLGMAKKWAADNNSQEYKDLIAYGTKVKQYATNWLTRQRYLESKSDQYPVIPVYAKYFFSTDPKVIKHLDDVLLQIADPNSLKGINGERSIGIIPLIIGAVVVVVAIVGIAYMVNQTHDTAQEKADLITATTASCQTLKMTKDDCLKVLTQAQNDSVNASGGIGSGIMTAAMIFLGLFAFSTFNKTKQAP